MALPVPSSVPASSPTVSGWRRLSPMVLAKMLAVYASGAWVAVVAFLALGLFHGMVVAALAGQYSRALPLVASRSRAIAAYGSGGSSARRKRCCHDHWV